MSNKVFALHFPGQGSQFVSMLSELSTEFAIVQETFARASAILGYDLWKIVQDGPGEELTKTEITQPALLTAGVAVWLCWRRMGGGMPAALAGHSLGEYTAWVVAGAMDFEDAVRLVQLRGQLMQKAVPLGKGAMGAIIGLENAVVASLCMASSEQAQAVVAPANFNAKGQVVVAGERAAVENALAIAIEKGAKLAKLLPVSVPSHCALMQPAATELTKSLESISWKQAALPVFQNLTAKPAQAVHDITQGLVDQLINPVRWVETVENMCQLEVACFLECGPGKVLAGLNKRIMPAVPTLGMDTPKKMEAALAYLTGETEC